MSTEKTAAGHPARPPKKFPQKSLHGRVRCAMLPYDDLERAKKFYNTVFGWDMFRLPQNVLGRCPDEATPDVVCATGPSQPSWEGAVPGYVSANLVHREPLYDKPYAMLEVSMDVSLEETLARIVAKGGKVLSGQGSGGDWAEVAMVEDPAGNRLQLWRCPDSRTWDEPETDYDKD